MRSSAIPFIAAIGCSLLMAGCDNSDKKPNKPLSKEQWLDICTPFESFDGKRLLLFKIPNHTLTIKEAVGPERERGALWAKNPMITKGSWSISDTTGKIEVSLAGASAELSLVVPFSEDQCILTDVDPEAADLFQSWYATPTFDLDEGG